MTSRAVGVIALAAMVRAAVAWLVLHDGLEPDLGLYAQGGIGLFPSPLGRLAGSAGPAGVAAVNVAANGLLVLGVAEVARSRGARPGFAALLVLVAPLALWSTFAGVDTAAAAALVWAAVARRAGDGRGAGALAAVAVGFHPAALLIVAAGFVRRVGLATGLVLVGAGVALLTPYGAIVRELRPAVVASSSVATAGVFVLTFAPWLRRIGREMRTVGPALAGGALAAGLVASGPWETNCRYLLPAVAVAAACSTREGVRARVARVL